MQFTILRDVQRAAVGSPFGAPAPLGMPAPRTAAPPAPKVEVEELDHRGHAELLRDPEVTAMAPVMPTKLIEPVADPGIEADGTPAWGIAAVGADSSPFTGQGVVVSVLDTGIDADHPAFAGVELVQMDFSGSGDGDRQGHGTHCAGTVFGRDVDGNRIGVARGVERALIGKVLGDDGGGTSDGIFRGIEWALANGAQVVSMSLGFDFPGYVRFQVDDGVPAELATSRALEAYRGNLLMFNALMATVQARAAFGSSAVVVAAAGNESQRRTSPDFEIAASLPAAADDVVSVAALAKTSGGLDVAPFSNTFAVISAPGVKILSANAGGGLRELNGTSMACPHVAGLAALWFEASRSIGLPPNAATVAAKLRAQARTDVFVDGLDPVDRGVGLAVAP